MSDVAGVDDLYGLALELFVPERTALARELRSAGRREEAGEVAALRKPSVAAWAINQLVRTQRRGFDELLEAGDALRAANDDVLAGRGDAESLRRALARERAAVDTLTRAARGLLSSEGHGLSPTIVERVADTLHAAALDDDARALVRDGRLERELRHVGLGMMAAGAGRAPAARAPGARGSAAGGPASKGAATAPKRAKDEQAVRAAAQERTKARTEARATEREARRRAERAVRGAEMARERRDRAAEALEQAERALADAERERNEADAGLADAERAVRDLKD